MELWWQKWIAVSLLEDFSFQSQNQCAPCYSGIGVNSLGICTFVLAVWLQNIAFNSSPLDTILSQFHQHAFLLNNRSKQVFRSLQWLGWGIRTAGIWRRVWFQTFQDNLVVCLQRSVCPRWDTRAELLLRDLYIWGWDQYLFSKRRIISASLRFILILSLHDSLFLFLKLLFSEGNQHQNSLFFYLPVLSTCLTTRISLDFKTLFHVF